MHPPSGAIFWTPTRVDMHFHILLHSLYTDQIIKTDKN